MAERKRAGLTEMLMVAGREADRIRFTQNVLIKGGMRTTPHEGEIRKAEVFEDITRLIAAIMPVRNEVLRVLGPTLKAMATAENYKKEEPEQSAPEPENED